MAVMASMRDIKRRKSSIQSTQQITRAMKLVATVKLQHARAEVEKSQTYFEYMYRTVSSMLSRVETSGHPFLTARPGGKKAVIVITSDRGLAGGYNSNIVRMILQQDFDKEQLLLYTIGSKGREMLLRKGFSIQKDLLQMSETPVYSEAAKLSKELLSLYENGEVSEIYVAYTFFKNTVNFEPKLRKLLPLTQTEDSDEEKKQAETKEAQLKEAQLLMNFEPSEEQVLDIIIPKYITSLIYEAMMDASASENAARMQAMDNATGNAEEMIEDLTLKYNRARQGSITQELTEIIAGAEAIS